MVSQPYRHGFVTDIASDVAAESLSEDTVRMISAKKNEPAWLLEFRLKALRHWPDHERLTWAKLRHPPIDFQNISYYAASRKSPSWPAWTRWTRNCCKRLRLGRSPDAAARRLAWRWT
ncbi:hypothetical protein [Candidatus Aalborgicola defluviihabitans]|uniref:hypothetical protein n=1 Tax=Candidatus Aalborgicola defluviihabitans TaxID=3386187 RepID=UPI0039B81F1F